MGPLPPFLQATGDLIVNISSFGYAKSAFRVPNQTTLHLAFGGSVATVTANLLMGTSCIGNAIGMLLFKSTENTYSTQYVEQWTACTKICANGNMKIEETK